jgi:hypothetical protein
MEVDAVTGARSDSGIDSCRLSERLRKDLYRARISNPEMVELCLAVVHGYGDNLGELGKPINPARRHVEQL